MLSLWYPGSTVGDRGIYVPKLRILEDSESFPLEVVFHRDFFLPPKIPSYFSSSNSFLPPE